MRINLNQNQIEKFNLGMGLDGLEIETEPK